MDLGENWQAVYEREETGFRWALKSVAAAGLSNAAECLMQWACAAHAFLMDAFYCLSIFGRSWCDLSSLRLGLQWSFCECVWVCVCFRLERFSLWCSWRSSPQWSTSSQQNKASQSGGRGIIEQTVSWTDICKQNQKLEYNSCVGLQRVVSHFIQFMIYILWFWRVIKDETHKNMYQISLVVRWISQKLSRNCLAPKAKAKAKSKKKKKNKMMPIFLIIFSYALHNMCGVNIM